VENIASYRVESDVMAMDFTLDWTGLEGAFKISGDAIAVLRNLDVLDLNLAGVGIGCINCPVALHVVWRLLGQADIAENQRRKNKTGDPQRRVHFRAYFFHDILL
jgi:hypothetical protein